MIRGAGRALVGGGVLALTGLGAMVLAGPPLNSFQGHGGMGFNPLAWTAGQPFPGGRDAKTDWQDFVSKPQVGAWYVRLSEIDTDWETFSVAESFLYRRLELSYCHEVLSTREDSIGKDDLGMKLLLVPENAGDLPFVPAVAVGGLFKDTDLRVKALSPDADRSGYEGYLVATKLITQLPRPLLISGGVLNSDEWVMGAFGHDDERDWTWFANLDVLPFPFLAVGAEYKQGSKYTDWRNDNYWNVHVGWMVDPHLTLCAAYIDGGNEDSPTRVGLGDAWTLTLQYSF